MRISVVLILIASVLAFSQADAKGRGSRANAAEVQVCDALLNGSKGLYGLCVAYCATPDLSNVDLNDYRSVAAAAPDRRILENYNRIKKADDPGMPCLQQPVPDDGGGSGGGDPTPSTFCPCWSDAELAEFDGNLPDTGLGEVLDCTTLTDSNGVEFNNQIIEGYDFLGTVSLEELAWAKVATEAEPYNGCVITSKEFGINRDFEVTADEAAGCTQAIKNQCAVFGNP